MNTLHEMYMAHPDSMQGLTSDDNYLVFGDERVDISRFDISTLFNPDKTLKETFVTLAKTHRKRLRKKREYYLCDLLTGGDRYTFHPNL